MTLKPERPVTMRNAEIGETAQTKCAECRCLFPAATGDAVLCDQCRAYHDEQAQRHEDQQAAEQREAWEREQMDAHFRRYPHG